MTKDEILAMQPGSEMDTAVAGLMEPQPAAISASALRERERMTEWYSTHDAYSPCSWWCAEIGTDHNKDSDGTFRLERDSAPVAWRPALSPSEDIAAAWRVVEAMWASGLDIWLHIYWDFTVCEFFRHLKPGKLETVGRAQAQTAPEAICKAALIGKIGAKE